MSTCSVLIVDDDKDLANSLADICRLFGHCVRVVFSGADALRAADSAHSDLVLLDFSLPDLDGTEVAAEIHRRDPTATVQMMSGYSADFVRRHARSPSLDSCITKPIDIERLLARLDSMGCGEVDPA